MVDPSPTPNIHLTPIRTDRKVWADIMNTNLRIIDAAVGAYFVVNNLRGVWENSESYAVGDSVIDESDSILYQVQVAHISASIPTTFAEDRVAHPTYWSTYSTPARFRGTWTSGSVYTAGDFVVSGPQYAFALVNHTAGATFAGDVALSKWSILIDLSTVGVAVLPVPGGAPDANKFVVMNPTGTGYTIVNAAVAMTLLGSSSIGQALFTAPSQAAARVAIGAAAAGSYQTASPVLDQVAANGVSVTGLALLNAADAEDARQILGVDMFLNLAAAPYNCLFDGTDESAKVQSAITDATAGDGGKTIIIPMGQTVKVKNLLATGKFNIKGYGSIMELAGPGWLFKHFQCSDATMTGIKFTDPNRYARLQNTTTGVVAPGDTVIPLNSVTGLVAKMLITLTLASGRNHVTTIVSVGASDVTILDPIPYTATAAAVDNGGADYTNNDVLAIPGLDGILVTVKAAVTAGACTGYTILCPGRVKDTPPANPLDLYDGSGTGATVDVTWEGMDSGAAVRSCWGLVLYDQTQRCHHYKTSFQDVQCGIQVIDTAVAGPFNTLGNYVTDVWLNAVEICAYARGTNCADDNVTGLKSYGSDGSGGFGCVGMYCDATNPTLAPGGNKYVDNNMLQFEIGTQGINCQLDMFVANINDTNQDASIFFRGVSGSQIHAGNSATFTGPTAQSGVGSQAAGMVLMECSSNNLSGLWLTTAQPNTGLLYLDNQSVITNTWLDAVAYYGSSGAVTGGTTGNFGPTGVDSSWTAMSPNEFPLYWYYKLSTAPVGGETVTIQLYKQVGATEVPIGPATFITGAGTATGTIQTYGYVAQLESFYFKVIYSASAVTSRGNYFVLMRR